MTHGSHASLLLFGPRHVFGLPGGFAYQTPTPLAPVFPSLAHAFHTCPHSSVSLWYRNLNLLSIGYASRPRLRSRLTQSRSALPDLPRADQLYSGNLGYSAGRIPTFLSLLIPAFSLRYSPQLLTGTASSRIQCSSTNQHKLIPRLRQCVSAPDIFGAGPLD